MGIRRSIAEGAGNVHTYTGMGTPYFIICRSAMIVIAYPRITRTILIILTILMRIRSSSDGGLRIKSKTG